MVWGWRCGLVVEYELGMGESLGSVPNSIPPKEGKQSGFYEKH